MIFLQQVLGPVERLCETLKCFLAGSVEHQIFESALIVHQVQVGPSIDEHLVLVVLLITECECTFAELAIELRHAGNIGVTARIHGAYAEGLE